MPARVDIEELLTQSANLPTLPGVATELLSISEWDDVDVGSIAAIISKDVSLSSKVLRVVNSAFYGASRQVSTISQAVVILGLRATRSLTLSFSVINASPADTTQYFDFSAFWTRSLNTATAARELARATAFHTEEEAFLAGLLQDVGVMVLAHCAPALYGEVLSRTEDKLAPSLEMEREVLGVDHAEVARSLLDSWNLPPSLSIPIVHHHEPDLAGHTDDQTRISILVQHLASCLGEWLYVSGDDSESLERIKGLSARYLDIAPADLDALMQRVDLKMQENAPLFEISGDRPDTYANLLQRANTALGEIATEQETLVRQLELAKDEAQKLSEQLRIANNKLLDEARTDALTELANRRVLREFLQQEVQRCSRYGDPLTVLFVDIDDFKLVNDRYGHLEGDAVLKRLADLMTRNVRACDVVARFGGEEFVMALVNTDEAGAMIAAKRISQAVQETPFRIAPGRPVVRLTTSVGVTVWHPETGAISPNTLLEQADKAMYQAKQLGKNRICRWGRGK